MKTGTNKMVIVAHQPLASALLKALRHVFVASAQAVEAIDVEASQNADEVVARLNGLACLEDRHTRLLLFTDLPGATPHNATQQFVGQQKEQGRQHVWLSGVNLPMLVRAWNYRDRDFDVFCQAAFEAAERSVLLSDARG